MTRRIAVIGTDTGVGKTAVTCAVLGHAARSGRRALPFKPAASGMPGEPTDADRLLRASGLPRAALEQICPLRYDRPLAPGIAEDPAPFLSAPRGELSAAFHLARRTLEALEREHGPSLVLIEGAGGLHVPMPDGTWLPAWLRALAREVIVVGRVGLGTINHTHLTIDAARDAGLTPLGFILVDTTGGPDPSSRHNAAIIANATNCPHLGTMPHRPDPDTYADWIGPSLAAVLS